jgi:hypothetical protein
MRTVVKPAKTSPASWDASTNMDVFVDAVLAKLVAMEAGGTQPTRSGSRPPLTEAALRKAIMAIWWLAFYRMQWRAIGLLRGVWFSTLYTLFACWTRFGLWRRLLDHLILGWRRTCGDKPLPSTVIIDSRPCPSAPSCFGRSFDGGRKMKGIKMHLAVNKYDFPLTINISLANFDAKSIVPVLHQLGSRGLKGTVLGDLSHRGQQLSKADETLGITDETSVGSHSGTFVYWRLDSLFGAR